MPAKIRLNRYLSRCGLASRRKADEFIASGRVSVNGQVIRKLGVTIDPKRDKVTIDGKPIRPPKRFRYFVFNKPAGYLCSRGDPFGRATIYDIMPAEIRGLKYLGRLDRDTEGLLILTDDGELIQRLTHPRYGVKRVYMVQIAGPTFQKEIAPLRQGVEYQGVFYRPAKLEILSSTPGASTLKLEIAEGKKREVRMMFRATGKEIISLKRIEYGPLKLGQLPLGKVRKLEDKEISALQNCFINNPS